MDIKTLLNNLHEEVSCSVCMNTFTDPKQLPCLHSFCLHCLNGILRTSGRRDIINCPQCRRESRVPSSGNLNDLPTNFRIKSLLDVLAIKECNTAAVKCVNCDKKSSQSSYCFQCCVFWCEECITGHNIIRANKEHRVLALKDFQDQDIEDVLKRPAFCSKPGHEKKELEFFCKNCEEPICNSCVATIHDGHVKILLEEAANERKVEVKAVVESQKEKAQKMREKIAKLDENSTIIQAQVANVKTCVQQFVDDMMAVMEAKKQEIFNEVENQGKQLLQRLEKQKFEIDNRAKMCETAVEKTETLLRRSTMAEILHLDKSLNTIFPEGVNNDEEQVDCDLEGLRRFMFVRNETLLQKTKNVSDCDEHCIKVLDRDGIFLYKFGKKGEGDGELNFPLFLSINKAGHLMVCDSSNHRVQVFELSGKFVTKFVTKRSGIGEFNKPVSTAVLSDGRVVVIDMGNKRIQIFE